MARHYEEQRDFLGTLTRRGFLRGTAVATIPLLAGNRFAFGFDAAKDAKPPALIPRETNPENLEYPFTSLKDYLTPNDLFYVRSHFIAPKLDAKAFRLKIGGAVEKPLELTYDQLQELPAKTLTATLECAGNGRGFLTPKPKGVPWELGAVSTAATGR